MGQKHEAKEGKPAQFGLQEVRYSLSELLREVKEEQHDSAFGQELVDQADIAKLFTQKKRGRGGKAGQ